MRVQTMHVTNRLKQSCFYLPKEYELFSLESSEFKDQMFMSQVSQDLDFNDQGFIKHAETGELNNILVIPSFKTIATITPLTFNQHAAFHRGIFEVPQMPINREEILQEQYKLADRMKAIVNGL